MWDAPGGFLNLGDNLFDALQRECRREMDVTGEVRDLVGAYEQEFLGMPIIQLVYRCEIATGEPRPADLIDAVDWFSLEALPEIAYGAIATALRDLRSSL